MSDISTCLRYSRFLAIVALALQSSLLLAEEKPAAPKGEKITYQKHVLPILRQKCFSCHNVDKKSGDLNLTTFSNVMVGGGSGEVISPGSAEDSYLYMLITHESEPAMPPKSDKLPDAMLAVIKKWIDGGALENEGSKPMAPKKPKFDFALKGAPTGKPEGPPPMPARMRLEPVLKTRTTTAVTALATSPWAPLAAVAGQQQVFLYNTQTLELLGVLPFPEGVPYVLKFSSTGNLLLAGGGRGAERGRVIVWNVQTGERVFEVGDELDAVLAADISADQTLIALGGAARVVRIYSTRTGKLLNELRKHTGWITSVAFSPDGVLLSTGDRNGGLFVWEAFTAREYLALRGHSGRITGLSWRADSNIIASSSEDGGIRLWEMQNGGNVKTWGAHGGGAASVEFARDGRIVSCGRDKVTKLWDQNGKQLIAYPAFGDLALQVTFCDETNRVVAGDWTGAIHVWQAADAAVAGDLTSNPLLLSERLDAAVKGVPPLEEKAKASAAAYQAAQAVATKTQADLDAANKSAAEWKQKFDAATTAIAQAKELVAKLTAEQQAAAKVVAAQEPVVAPLKEAADKALLAASKTPDDKELAAAAAAIKTQSDAKTAQLAASQKAAADKQAELEKAKQLLATSEKQLAEAKPALEAAQKLVADVTPKLKPATDAAAAAKVPADADAGALASAKAAVARWTDEIEYEKRRKNFVALRDSFNEFDAVAQLALNDANAVKAERDTANQAVQTAQKEVDAANAAVKQATDALTKAAGEEAAAKKGQADLEALLPLVSETLAKGQVAAQKAPGDKQVTDAAAVLKKLVDDKTAALAAAKKLVPEKTSVVAKATEQLNASKKVAADKAAALAAAQKVAAEKEALVKPADEKFAAAKTAADAAGQKVEQARVALDPAANAAQAQAQAPATKS